MASDDRKAIRRRAAESPGSRKILPVGAARKYAALFSSHPLYAGDPSLAAYTSALLCNSLQIGQLDFKHLEIKSQIAAARNSELSHGRRQRLALRN